MSNFSLYTRLREFGTISNSADEIPDALYALPSTINWMRALALTSNHVGLSFQSARSFYSGVQVRKHSEAELNTALEQLLFALNQIACLKAMATSANKADVARMAIVAWYYAIYGSASAMIAVADGSFQETHAATANQWDQIFASKQMAMPPFSDRMTNLLSDTIDQELKPIRLRGQHSLTVVPKSGKQAWGCVAEYLSGCAKWEQWNLEQRVRGQSDFKALGVSNFRTKDARAIRDKVFQRASISFLHQAFRYRGKANYRDAIFLAYGKGVASLVDGLVDDLADVAARFSMMAAGYISTRVGKRDWDLFLQDLESKRSVSVSPLSLWQ